MHLLTAALVHPVYGVITAIILVEVSLVALQVLWLFAQAVRLWRLHRHAARFAAELGDRLSEVGRSDAERGRWLARARRYPRAIVRQQLEPVLALTHGEARTSLIAIYTALDFLAEDIAMSRSSLPASRMRAVRRLSLVATAEEAPVLLERRHDRHMIRVVAGQTLVRVGTADQLYAFLREMRVQSRIMEQPLAESLVGCTPEQIDLLLDRLPELVDPALRRLVLVASARVSPTRCMMQLPLAAASSEKEVRIAACLAIARLGAPELAPLLVGALGDEAFEVRAQAAKALGQLRAVVALDALTKALEDRGFWVRQNAAAALAALGAPGRARLRAIVDEGRDEFAVDTARQELRRIDLLAEAGALAS